MVSKKAIANKLNKRIQRKEMEVRQLQYKKLVESANQPDYIIHYKNQVPVGEERVNRVSYIETKPKDGSPSSYHIDLRKFVKRKRKVKEGDDEWRAVFRNGIYYRPETWNAVYNQLTELTMELSEPDDWITILKSLIEKSMKKYPEAYQKAFHPLNKQVAPQNQVVKNNFVNGSIQKPVDIKKDENWIRTLSDQKKTEVKK